MDVDWPWSGGVLLPEAVGIWTHVLQDGKQRGASARRPCLCPAKGSSSERADTVGGHTARPVLLSEHATKEPRATRRQGNDEPCHDDGGAHALLEQRRNARPASAPREACRHALSWVPLQLSEREQSRKLSPPNTDGTQKSDLESKRGLLKQFSVFNCLVFG